MEPLALIILVAVYFGPVLYLRRKTRLGEGFRWPFLYFLVAFALSFALTPLAFKATDDWRALHEKVRAEVYVLVAVVYFLGWWRSGRKVYWIVCLATTSACFLPVQSKTRFAVGAA